MFGTVSLPKTKFSDFYFSDLLLRKARGIQAFLQQQDFLIALMRRNFFSASKSPAAIQRSG